MKKLIAFLLAAILTLNMGLTADAAQSDPAMPSEQADEKETEEAPAGQVTVVIGAALDMISPTDFSVKLTDSQGKEMPGSAASVSVGGKSDAGSGYRDEDSVRFCELEEGIYTLRITAPKFADYVQSVNVKNKAYTIRLMTGFLEGEEIVYEEGASHPGVLLVGDVDGDGRIDSSDRNKLVEDIDTGNYAGESDLNGDGKVDLADLEYFTKGYNETRHTIAKEEISVSSALIAALPGNGTIVEGEPEDALTGENSVILRPESGLEISPENPVALEFMFDGTDEMTKMDGIIIATGDGNQIENGFLEITYAENGNLQEPVEIPIPEDGIHLLLKNNEGVSIARHGDAVWISLGQQIAVKKVTFTITKMTKDSSDLAEISKVEFVNGMGDRIPDPELDIPVNVEAAASSKKVSVKWDPCVNITGYEVLVRQGERQETVMVNKNAFDLTSFGGKELANYQEYRIQVRSVNGTWRSGYSDEVTATPKPNSKPDKPDNVSAVGKYQSIEVSWKAMKDTLSYNLYYREGSEGEYLKISDIKGNSYTIQKLKDLTEYNVYVTSVNEFGESGPSLTVSATTTDMNPAVMPKYNLINTGEEGEAGAHIINVTANGVMYESPLDTGSGTAWGTVDHNPASYYYKGSWDDGGFNAMGLQHGLTYEFDQAYKMDTIALQESVPQSMAYFYAKVRYWDAEGNRIDLGNVSVRKKTDADGRIYYMLKLPQAVEAKKLQFGLARYLATGNVPITVSEVYFYYYDTLMDEIMALYTDDLHTVLRADVTQNDIDALRTKINTADPVSGEYHPDRAVLELELQTAEAILKDAKLNDSVVIYNSINTKDVDRGFGGLNAWQPLGVTAAAQEEIMVYVGHNTKKTGESTNLQLIATQYHAESGSMYKTVATLKVGPNKVTVPKIWSAAGGIESGGALYIQYTGNSQNDRYAVRVSGGVQVPKLDLYQVTDEAEKLARAENYLRELQVYVEGMEAKHAEIHKGGANSQVNIDYNEQNCILGASDIMLDTMMLSLPAKQILAGTGTGTAEQRAARLVDSMKAMEDMMDLFYQHKGLNRNAENAVDRIPCGHLNIRYQRMFSGAFMYASGNHIGIEWGSASGLTGVTPVQADAEGRYVSGSYFGWGIAHEIGHCINQGAYAVAEVTNNYYSVLAQAKDTNGSVRFSYDNVYRKVTSGTKGAASNVFTQLGMYWQLHLAYDSGYNYKTYEDYDEQLSQLFFARVDTYARTPSRAPAPGGVALALEGDGSQKLMRLACAAAEKDILEFFRRWGMTPNAGTCAYAEQFPKETRAIYYVCDDSRVYSLGGGSSQLGNTGSVEAVGDDVMAAVSAEAANKIDIRLSAKNIPQEDVLGYEIVRCTIEGGQTMKEAVGFTVGNSFSDTLSVNNRVVWYEITVIDKYLNRSAVKALDPLKIEHDGSLDKFFWTITTDGMETEEDSSAVGTVEDPCEPEPENTAVKLIDNDVNTVFKAVVSENAEVVIEFNKTLTVAGFKYTTGDGSTEGGYEIQVCSGENWITAVAGSFGQERVNTVHFGNAEGDYISTYTVSAVKLIFRGSGTVSLAELDVLGVTGDNVDFGRTEDSIPAIGELESDYKYGEEEGDIIPAGSIVFTGTYKGNPAYNVVVLYDQDGNIVGGTDEEGNLNAHQIILADVPEEGDIRNVWNGTWIYWIDPGQQISLGKDSRVRAELYRVNNAMTNEGQRLVSDSLFEAVPEMLPPVRIEQ